MSLRSEIYRGTVVHERCGPVAHAFSYPMTFFAFDLAELDALAEQTRLFRHNDRAVLSLRDCDYLHGNAQAIEPQLEAFLPPLQAGQRTMLVTSPRYFGYAFNPVNFYLRLDGAELLCAIAEVNNTFGDRHIYPLTELCQSAADTWTASCPKDFHVSPFNDLRGDYAFTFKVTAGELYLGVDLHRDGACVLRTWIQGNGHAIHNRAIRRYALYHPWDTALNSLPRIVWQAAVLAYRKQLAVHPRPAPHSAHTVINRDTPETPHVI